MRYQKGLALFLICALLCGCAAPAAVEEETALPTTATEAVQELDALEAIEAVKATQVFCYTPEGDGLFLEGTTYGDIFREKYFLQCGWLTEPGPSSDSVLVMFYYNGVVIDGEPGETNEDGPMQYGFLYDRALDTCLPMAIYSGASLMKAWDGEDDADLLLVANTIAYTAACWATDLLNVRQPATEAATEVVTQPTEPESQVPYLLTIPRADQSIFSGPGYDYGFVRTVELAGIYTIVEETWDAEGNLWGRLKSGVGWVDLTQIRSEADHTDPISANYADAALLDSGNYHHCIADTSEYMVQIAFRANETLTDVAFYALQLNDAGYEQSELLYSLAQLTPDTPFVADVAFPGDLSAYGIRFTDERGESYSYCVTVSGRNGALLLSACGF